MKVGDNMQNFNNELYHYGVKGMKWGVRHDRNRSHNARKRAGKYFEQSIKTKNGKISPAEKISRDVRSSTDSINNISRRIKRNKDSNRNRNAYKEVSKMSDAELRSRINRMQMEKQYKIMTSENSKAGYDYVSDVLDTIGDVATVAGSVASTIAIMSMLRNKRR